MAAPLSPGGWGGVIQVNEGRRVTERECKMETPAGQLEDLRDRGMMGDGVAGSLGPDQAPSCRSCEGATGRSYDVLRRD